MNCHNCGAPVSGGRCEYCGTFTELPSPKMAIGKEVSISFEHDGIELRFKMRVDDFSLEDCGSYDELVDWSGMVVATRRTPDFRARIGGRVVPIRDGALIEEMTV